MARAKKNKTTGADVAAKAAEILSLTEDQIGGRRRGNTSVADLLAAAKAVAGSALAQAEAVAEDPKKEIGRDPATFRANINTVQVVPSAVYHADGTKSTGLISTLLVVHADVPQALEAALMIARALNQCPEAVAAINR